MLARDGSGASGLCRARLKTREERSSASLLYFASAAPTEFHNAVAHWNTYEANIFGKYVLSVWCGLTTELAVMKSIELISCHLSIHLMRKNLDQLLEAETMGSLEILFRKLGYNNC